MKCRVLGVARAATAIAALAGSAALAGEPSHAGRQAHAVSQDRAATGMMALPSLRIVSPVFGAKVSPDIKVEFETDADLTTMTMSSETIGVHLHIGIDDNALTPMTADLTPLGKTRYRYAFDLPAAPGQCVISVYWSDASHKTIESSVQKVTVVVVPSPGKGKP